MRRNETIISHCSGDWKQPLFNNYFFSFSIRAVKNVSTDECTKILLLCPAKRDLVRSTISKLNLKRKPTEKMKGIDSVLALMKRRYLFFHRIFLSWVRVSCQVECFMCDDEFVYRCSSYAVHSHIRAFHSWLIRPFITFRKWAVNRCCYIVSVRTNEKKMLSCP